MISQDRWNELIRALWAIRDGKATYFTIQLDTGERPDMLDRAVEKFARDHCLRLEHRTMKPKRVYQVTLVGVECST